jgi:putative membrane protein
MNLSKSIFGVTVGTFASLFLAISALAQDNPKLSDPEVANVAVVANQIDIDNAALAKKKSKNTAVLQFAENMASSHKAVIGQAVALVTKLKVTPQDNAVSKQLQSDAQKTRTKLNTLSGRAFDKAYIDNEVAYHKAVINALEGLLIPEAENAELKGLLQNVVPKFKAHLEHAQMVQKQNSGK